MSFLIKLGSVTNAQRALAVLRQRGYKPILSRLENPRSGDGCGYVLKLSTNDKHKVFRILSNAGIKILGVEEL